MAPGAALRPGQKGYRPPPLPKLPVEKVDPEEQAHYEGMFDQWEAEQNDPAAAKARAADQRRLGRVAKSTGLSLAPTEKPAPAAPPAEDGVTSPGQAARGRTGGRGPGTRGSSRPGSRPASQSWTHPTLTPSTSDGTGFLLGMLLYALGLNYLRQGPAGVKGWLSAKFLNKVTLTSSTGNG